MISTILLLIIFKTSYSFDLYTSSVLDSNGKLVDLSNYRNKILLLTNVASECGFTDSQYKMFIDLKKKYQATEFEILAFPCNDFGGQEPNESQYVRKWAQEVYKINFPVMEKISFRDNQLPDIWKYVLDNSEKPSWNFWKYLIDSSGNFVQYYDSFSKQSDLEQDINKLLEKREDL